MVVVLSNGVPISRLHVYSEIGFTTAIRYIVFFVAS